MFSSPETLRYHTSALTALLRTGLAALALSLTANLAQAQSTPFAGIGRTATPKEVKAWDIDVRADFKGLPAGSGSVAKGQDVWEGKCASCHGIFGESNEVFMPLVGGTTAEDIKTGRVARLNDASFPGRTTLMKVSTVSTLWDYINRAMPWTQPKSLSVEEVYAVTAFLLNLGGIVPDDFVLSDRNIAQVQQRLPNRNGVTTNHGMWPGRSLGNGGKPDTQAVACMRDCPVEARVASYLPDHARNAHGNLAEQNRLVGAQIGADTTRPAPPAGGRVEVPAVAPASDKPTPTPQAPKAAAPAGAPTAVLNKNGCVACHGMDNKLVGPSFREVAKKYADRADAVAYLSGRIRAGSSGVWGAIPMPPQTIAETDATAIAQWLKAGAPK